MSITITIPDVSIACSPARRAGDLGRAERYVLLLLGPVMLPIAEDLIPGLGIAMVIAGVLRLRVSL